MEEFGLVSKLAITIVLLLATGLLAGWGLDAWLGSTPVFLLVGAGAGISWSIWAMFKLTKSFREPKAPENK